jgi:hypothetical protein
MLGLSAPLVAPGSVAARLGASPPVLQCPDVGHWRI